MFLVDSALASDDWEGTLKNIENQLTRYDADIESIKKWDSRKLAYRIRGKTHGTYILSYFRIDGEKITSIERDIQLSDNIMRVLILRTDKMSQEDLQKNTPVETIEKREKEIAEKVRQKTRDAKPDSTSDKEEQEPPDRQDEASEALNEQEEKKVEEPTGEDTEVELPQLETELEDNEEKTSE
jgi:small subunit ribosomal protein S6